MGATLIADDARTSVGPLTGQQFGKITVGLYVMRDPITRAGPWYQVTCDCGNRYRVPTATIKGPKAARGCKMCRRHEKEARESADAEKVQNASPGRWRVKLRQYQALTPQQRKDFALMMRGREMTFRNVTEALEMAQMGLTQEDRDVFIPQKQLLKNPTLPRRESRTGFYKAPLNQRRET